MLALLPAAAVLAVLATLPFACGGEDSPDPPANTVDGIRFVLDTMNDELPPCPVTAPNGDTPPDERPSPNHHGNGELWTGLYPEGTVVFGPGWPGFIGEDGSLSMKFWWWRADAGEPLVIEGRRLDASAPPMFGDVPDGYGGTFQATGLVFPTPGCWEVTGRARSASLTFVTRVILMPPEPDALAIVALAAEASAHVRTVYDDAVLQAIDVATVTRDFRYITRQGSCGREWCQVNLAVPSEDSPPAPWLLSEPAESDLPYNPGIAMHFSPYQMVGLASVRQALAAYDGCEPDVVTLALDQGATIEAGTQGAWYARCPSEVGLVRTLRIDAQNGHVSPVDDRRGSCLGHSC